MPEVYICDGTLTQCSPPVKSAKKVNEKLMRKYAEYCATQPDEGLIYPDYENLWPDFEYRELDACMDMINRHLFMVWINKRMFARPR